MIWKPFSPRPLLFVISLLLLSISASHSQQKPPNAIPREIVDDEDVVRVTTSLVTIPVSVSDRKGRFIPNLSQQQFRIFEDGSPQELAYFENADKPFTVALLLDTSDSTRFNLRDIQNAAIAFVDQLRAEDRVLVAAFDQRFTLLSHATKDRSVLRNAIRNARAGGGTSLYNAMDFVMTNGLDRIQGRKALVLFTDGVDTTSRDASYQSTLRAADELDALVYAIQYNTYDTVAKDGMAQGAGQSHMVSAAIRTANGVPLDVAYGRATRFLQLITDKTGGRHYFADSLGHLSVAFTRISQELRQQYSIGYYPSTQNLNGQRRKIKVSVDVDQAVVRARKSYLGKQSGGAQK